MIFSEPARRGQFIKRYKRFFVDVRLEGAQVTAHLPNTGSLKTCLSENAECVVTENSDPNRKLKATLQFIKTPQGWAGVNTALPNKLVYEAWENGLIKDWQNYGAAKPEYKISKETRFDLALAPGSEALSKKEGLCFIEVKNVTMAENGVAKFPDAVTERGQKHLRELTRLVGEGARCELVFVIQREGCRSFSPADEIDPEYGRLLREASGKGVRLRALCVRFDLDRGVSITGAELPIEL